MASPARSQDRYETEKATEMEDIAMRERVRQASADSQVSVRGTRQNIDNPFLIYSPHDLDQVIRETAHGLHLEQWYDLLERGAKIARDRSYALDELTQSDRLSDEEDAALKREEKGFWSQSSKVLRGSMLVASLGAIIQGWTESVNSGANLGIITDFSLRIYQGNDNDSAVWRFAILNAIPLFAGGIISPLIVDPLQDYYLGRRGTIFVSSLLTLASTIAASFMHSYAGLLVMRGLSGVALGAKASVIPIYASEISPPSIRGRIGANWQIMDALGIALGFVAVLSIQSAGLKPQLYWRLMTATIVIPTLLLIFLVYTSAAESPYWKLKKSQPVQSFQDMRSLRRNDLIAAKDFIYCQAQLEIESRLTAQRRSAGDEVIMQNLETRLEEAARAQGLETPHIHAYLYEIRKTGYWQRFVTLISDQACRRALLCSSWAMASQQLTGINTIVFLFFILLTKDPIREPIGQKDLMTNAYIGFAFGAVNFLCGLPAYWLADRVGRATLMLFGLPIQACLTLGLAFCLKITDPVAKPTVCGIAICLYTAIYSFTSGPFPFAIASEVFPLSIREVGMAASLAVNFTMCGIVLLFFVPLSNAMAGSYSSTLCIFAGLNIVAFVGVFLFVPETKGRTLEEMQFTFDLPLLKHIKYRIEYESKWCWNRYIVRRQVEDMVPFYRWARQQ